MTKLILQDEAVIVKSIKKPPSSGQSIPMASTSKAEVEPKPVESIDSPEYPIIKSPTYLSNDHPEKNDQTPTAGGQFDFDLELHLFSILDYEPWDDDDGETRGESILDDSNPKVKLICLADDTVLIKTQDRKKN